MTVDIAILITVCGRNLTCKTLDETPLYKIFLPFFHSSKEEAFEYKIYLGIDDNDPFFLPFLEELRSNPLYKVVILSNCNHKPAKAWNILFEKAYNDGFEYFFQVGDDVAMTTPNWTSRFVNTLRTNGNFGITGPMDEFIFEWRKGRNLHQVIENAFVHRTHYQIFQSFFHPEINNQFCDDWITAVYDKFALLNMKIKCENTVRNARYNFEKVPNIKEYIEDGKELVRNYRSKLKVVDTFIFYNEYDILELRLNELYEVVDYFVLVEANVTHSGLKKDWNFEKHKTRYEQYMEKIIYIKCDDILTEEVQKSSWQIENEHRNAISRSFLQFKNEDIILMSDIDEIPRREVIEQIRYTRLPLRLHMDFYNYNFNCRVKPDWEIGTVAFFLGSLGGNPPQCLRFLNLPFIEKGGWHFSWFGDENFCKEKIRSFAHQELNNEQILENFKNRMEKYEDYYAESGRNWKFNHIYLQSDLPKAVGILPFLNKYIDNPKINSFFVTYGDSKFCKSRERIIKEAKESGLFKDCFLYTEESLTAEFKTQFSYLLNQSRGGGYWCWKFFVFLDALTRTKEGDWITYADAGCILVEKNKASLTDLISNMIIENKIISAFPCKGYKEKIFTKGDILDFFSCRENENVTETDIFIATLITFKNCKETRGFFQKICDIALNHQSFLDDSPSISPNIDGFFENRHDQSLLSVYRKLHPNLVYTTEDRTWKSDFFIQAERIRE